MMLQNWILPVVYRIYKHRPVKKGYVLLADCHNDHIPYSMTYMYETLCAMGVEPYCFFLDFKKHGAGKIMMHMLRFMKAYAQAEAVFICDYYLPAASCKKRKETQLVQLWHACGAFKKFGYDAPEDIPEIYKGNPMGNCTLVTVSSNLCQSIYAKAFHLPESAVLPLGISRTDGYFNETYKQRCQELFHLHYPKAKGKKVLLWAPTFRGNAGRPVVEGLEAVEELKEKLGNQWYVMIQLHPHLQKKTTKETGAMTTEELLVCADVVMTDYSSILFDGMLMGKPVVLFAPDKQQYLKHRGLYLDYNRIPAVHVRDQSELVYAVKSALTDVQDTRQFCEEYVGACDGNATWRIIQHVFNRRSI